ncbi:MAG: hypothetical protein IKZ05_03435, partial [Clostridia bacterium]|nr:hypothetical protein [Clostridia bacterium]
MKKCCFILKFIAMMLVVVLIFPLCLSLTGCNGTKKEIIAEMISRAYVSYGEDVYGKNGEYHAYCGYSNSLPFDVATPLIRTEAIAFSGGRSYTGEREINVNGEIHKAKSGQENLKSVYFDGTLASA